MITFLQRMKIELEELEIKMNKCGAFLVGEINGDTDILDKEGLVLLSNQFGYMKNYSRVLKARLDKGNKEEIEKTE